MGSETKLFALALVAALSIAVCPRALAQQSATTARAGTGSAAAVRSEVFVVLASETEGTIDPALSEIPALRRPPFNAFHTMEVLSRTTSHLSAEQPIEVQLPNGRQLRVELERPTEDGRYRVRVSINTPGQSDYLPLLQIVASPGDPFFVAGQNWQGGTLVIGVRIGQRPAAR
ncbi:hypothetical protein [Sandaracinus amylolyticus]|uniref:hypothetical protein n=1 Tax=Sandaracinus amylolyticus TaxID=927083 RepID=UPI001F39E77A|nr:hypothetical protein [Sandaracinus amylolyticus]UJR82054.1 Hypothetical protein I5071_41190 [Sandaracinus amylolyticus]